VGESNVNPERRFSSDFECFFPLCVRWRMAQVLVVFLSTPRLNESRLTCRPIRLHFLEKEENRKIDFLCFPCNSLLIRMGKLEDCAPIECIVPLNCVEGGTDRLRVINNPSNNFLSARRTKISTQFW
jgi:hypothetical protein